MYRYSFGQSGPDQMGQFGPAPKITHHVSNQMATSGKWPEAIPRPVQNTERLLLKGGLSMVKHSRSLPWQSGQLEEQSGPSYGTKWLSF